MELPPLNRVPGETKIRQKEFVLEKDLTKHSRRELLEIKERQLKLLENKPWINKLPDKGEKIQNLYERALDALKRKEENESSLKLEDIENLEWEGRIIKKEALDSDDEDEVDPLAVLASTNSVLSKTKIIKHETPVKPLITEQDIKEAKSEPLVFDPVLQHCCDIEKLTLDNRFLPYKNAKVHECPAKDRDNSAASPPVNKKTTIMLSLRESMEVENKNRNLLKDVTERHTQERLAERMIAMKAAGITITTPHPAKPSFSNEMSKYRLPVDEVDVDSDSDSYESALSDEDNA